VARGGRTAGGRGAGHPPADRQPRAGSDGASPSNRQILPATDRSPAGHRWTYVYCMTYGNIPGEILPGGGGPWSRRRIGGAVAGPAYRALDPELQLLGGGPPLRHRPAGVRASCSARSMRRRRRKVLRAVTPCWARRSRCRPGSWPADRAAFRALTCTKEKMIDHPGGVRRSSGVGPRPASTRSIRPWRSRPPCRFNRFPHRGVAPRTRIRLRVRDSLGCRTAAPRRPADEARLAPSYRRLPLPLREAPKTYYLRDMRKNGWRADPWRRRGRAQRRG